MESGAFMMKNEAAGPLGSRAFWFVLLSLLLHLLLLILFRTAPFWQQQVTDDVAPSFRLILSRTEKKTPPQAKAKQNTPRTPAAATPLPDNAATRDTPDALHLYDDVPLALESLLRQEKQQADQRRFGRADPQLQPEWLSAPKVSGSKAFEMESFAVNDGETLVVMKFANGSTRCFNVLHADPFDPYDMGIWRFTRCN